MHWPAVVSPPSLLLSEHGLKDKLMPSWTRRALANWKERVYHRCSEKSRGSPVRLRAEEPVARMACLPKVEPEIIDLSISDSDSDCGGGDGCAHACTCEFDSKEGVLVKDDDDCVDVTSDFAAPTPPMGTSSEGGGPGGLPDISLYDEVHHLIRAVQQVRALPNVSTWIDVEWAHPLAASSPAPV